MTPTEPLREAIPSPLDGDGFDDQVGAVRGILPNPAERIVVTVLCRRCGAALGTVRKVNNKSCPLVWIGTHKSHDLIDYAKSRIERFRLDESKLQDKAPILRRRVTSTATYSTALGRRSTPATLPVRCDAHGDATVTTSDLMAAVRANPPQPTIRIRPGSGK